ncbi:PREDICTED: GPI mannosyltransferase 4-like [Priapulus caudatus]|uniref:Mannosyltransferase n=1 Tax=Priapulus caudatus TaxID=37621 RepID=A0ABM1DZD5_PRICU|nr:PREDICTED: GPI mannosyltransferase 4-like [Priapulus caudatus]
MHSLKFEMLLWIGLVALRLGWTFLPQTGYIHPDEFFQSTEVVAGDIFDLEVMKTWEFNSNQSIRSIIFPYLTCGVPYNIIKAASETFDWKIESYWLLVGPRFAMTLLSLLIDWILYRTCKASGVTNVWSCLATFACSYIVLVHLTRTLSNSMETLLFALLIYVVTQSLQSQHRTLLGGAACNGILRESGCIGAIVVAGTFNRPTFFAFAVVPCLYWLTCRAQSGYVELLAAFVNCLPWLLMTTFAFALGDSLYYGSVRSAWIREVADLRTWPTPLLTALKNLTWTPVNFVKYNLKDGNLALHGLHPKYLHFLVNFPLLFGLVAFASIVLPLKDIAQSRSIRRKDGQGKMMMLLSIWIPLLLLSVFPHQEPRFLMPLIIPLVLLMHEHILGTKVLTVLKWSWIMWNILGCVIFGAFHQGGVTKSLLFLNNEIEASSENVSHVVFYYTYMPPRHLLQIHKATSETSTQVLDLSGATVEQLRVTISDIASKQEKSDGKRKEIIYLVAPSVVDASVEQVIKAYDWHVVKLFPHISMEALPNWEELSQNCRKAWTETPSDKSAMSAVLNVLRKIAEAFSLSVFMLK